MRHFLYKIFLYFRPYIFSVCAGLASFFAFAPYSQFWILFFTLPCLVFYTNEAKTKTQAVLQAGLFGGVFFETSLFWAVKGLFSEFGLLVYVLFVIFLFLLGFFFYGAAAFLARFFKKGLARIIAFLVFISLSEYVQSYFIFRLSWLFMANAWVNFPAMLQFFNLAGTFGYGFLTLFIFTSPVFLFSKEKHYISFILAVVLTGVIFLYGHNRLKNMPSTEHIPDINLRLVQKHQTRSFQNIPAYITPVLFDNEIFSALKKPFQSKGKTLLFFAETFIRTHIKDEPLLFTAPLEKDYPDFYIFTGALRTKPKEKSHNSILVVDNKARILDLNDKYQLVPVGEYIPFIDNFRNFTRGKGPKTFHLKDVPAVGAVNCVEITYPRVFIDQKDRPLWIAAITNDSSYLNTLGTLQYLTFSQIRAVEEGLPVVKISTPHGVSAVINPYGQIEAFLPKGQIGILDAALPTALPPTFYSRFGNIPFLAGSVFLLTICFFISFFTKKSPSPEEENEKQNQVEKTIRPSLPKAKKAKEIMRQKRAEKRKRNKK